MAESNEELIERLSIRAYNTHLKELPGGKFPPIWENISENVRNWIREQVKNIISEIQNPTLLKTKSD